MALAFSMQAEISTTKTNENHHNYSPRLYGNHYVCTD